MSESLVFKHECVVLDACCLINLYATDLIHNILETTSVQFAVCSYVKEREVRHVYDGSDKYGSTKKTPVDLTSLISDGILDLIFPDMAKLSSRVIVFANRGIQNGEVITGVVAESNNWAIGSDDINARDKFAVLVPQLQVISSYELVKYWAETQRISDDLIGSVIRKIRDRGRFVPSEKLPLFEWANKHLFLLEQK